MIKPTLRSIASTEEANVPKFYFLPYVKGDTYHNNDSRIDFVTDGEELYVCVPETLVTSADKLSDQTGMLKLVSKGEPGRDGAAGRQGLPGHAPTISAKFEGDQLSIYADGRRIATTTGITGPAWKPKKINNTITWERSFDDEIPMSINLDELRADDYTPILLRANSDNAKRDDETSGPANFIQWKYEGQEEWSNLISISELMNLALAGISIWLDENDGQYHLGHREVVKASYASSKEGPQIISDVELGEVLFDAGAIPIGGGSIIPEDLEERLQEIIDMFSNYATKEWVNDQNFLTEHQTLKTINNQSLIGSGNIVIEGGSGIDPSEFVKTITINNGSILRPTDGNINIRIGDYNLFDLVTRTVNDKRHLIKIVNGIQTDLGVFENGTGGTTPGGDVDLTALQLRIGDPSDSTKRNHLFVSYNDGFDWSDVGEFVDSDTIQDLTDYITRSTYQAGINNLQQQIDNLIGSDPTVNVVHYRTFLVYRWYKPGSGDPSTPSKPAGCSWDTTNNILTLPVDSPWKESPDNNPGDGSLLWMTSASFDSRGTAISSSDWKTPVCISGVDGNPGADGSGIEFIFKQYSTEADYTADSSNIPSDSEPLDTDGHWYNHPQGIDVDHEVEAASMRTYNGSSWTHYCAPFIWSKWGENGIDGDGVEYIYRLDLLTADGGNVVINSSTGEITLTDTGGAIYPPTADYFEDSEFVEPAHYQHADWVPGGTNPDATTGQTEEGWYSDSGWDRNWMDEPANVNASQPFQFVSVRKYRDRGDGVKEWSPFSEPKLWVRYVTDGRDGASGRDGSYASYIFTRTSTPNFQNATLSDDIDPSDITTTLGGQTVNVTWEDTIPVGSAPVWMAYNMIGDNPDTGWSSPQPIGDSSRIQVEFSAEENAPTAYTLPDLNDYIDDTDAHGVDEEAFRRAAGLKDPSDLTSVVWGDEDDIVSPIWMATAVRNGGVWSGWTYAKIKGETGAKGEDGTSFAPIGSVNVDIEDYTDCTSYGSNNWKSNIASFNNIATVGSSILVTVFDNGVIDHTDMWVYYGDRPSDDLCPDSIYGWHNAGPLQGPAGENSYIHQKFANENPSGALCPVVGKESSIRLAFTPITQPFEHIGEFPGKYVGMYVDFTEADSETITDYKWAKWSGDDGFGMEQIFILNETQPATPVLSNASQGSPATIYCNKVTLADGTSVTTNVDQVYYKYNSIPEITDSTDAQNPIVYTWQDRPITPEDGVPCWISVRKLDKVSLIEWSEPIIYDKYARDGVDGDFEEYVYFRTETIPEDPNTHQPITPNLDQYRGLVDKDRYQYSDDHSDPYVNQGIQHKDFLPAYDWNYVDPEDSKIKGIYWTDNPQGVNSTLKYEWCAKRTCDHSEEKLGEFSEFSTPFIWSHFGGDGRDGDGIEYVFFAVTKDEHDLIESSSSNKVLDQTAYQRNSIQQDPTKDEFLPRLKSNITRNGERIYATDDNPGVSTTYPYVYASIRRYGYFGNSVASWQDFDPISLWLVAPEEVLKFAILDITNDTEPIIVDDNNIVVSANGNRVNTETLVLRDENGNWLLPNKVKIGNSNFVEIDNTGAKNHRFYTVTYNNVTLIPDYVSSEEDTLRRGISFKVNFGNNYTLNDIFSIPLTVVSGEYSATGFIELIPTTEENFVKLFTVLPSSVRTSGEGTHDYSVADYSLSVSGNEISKLAQCQFWFWKDNTSNSSKNIKLAPSYKQQIIGRDGTDTEYYYLFDANGSYLDVKTSFSDYYTSYTTSKDANNKHNVCFAISYSTVDLGDNSKPYTRWLCNIHVFLNNLAEQNYYPIDTFTIGVGISAICEKWTAQILYPGKDGRGKNGNSEYKYLTLAKNYYNILKAYFEYEYSGNEYSSSNSDIAKWYFNEDEECFSISTSEFAELVDDYIGNEYCVGGEGQGTLLDDDPLVKGTYTAIKRTDYYTSAPLEEVYYELRWNAEDGVDADLSDIEWLTNRFGKVDSDTSAVLRKFLGVSGDAAVTTTTSVKAFLNADPAAAGKPTIPGSSTTDNALMIAAGVPTASAQLDTFQKRANASNFRVYENGELYASEAHIEGEVTANSGNIGYLTIANGKLRSEITNPTLNNIHLPAIEFEINDTTHGHRDMTFGSYLDMGQTDTEIKLELTHDTGIMTGTNDQNISITGINPEEGLYVQYSHLDGSGDPADNIQDRTCVDGKGIHWEDIANAASIETITWKDLFAMYNWYLSQRPNNP